MECEQVREAFLTRLPEAGAGLPDALARHVERCAACRAELEGLSRTWARLDALPEVSPPEHLRLRLARQVRRRLRRDSLVTLRGWVPAALAAAIGVAVSLGLSGLVPYSRLVALCQAALDASDVHTAPYLLAGLVYGIPLAAGVWGFRHRVVAGGVLGGLEASALFLVILAPYVLIQCREFPPVLQAAFLSGLGAGALVASLASLALARRRVHRVVS